MDERFSYGSKSYVKDLRNDTGVSFVLWRAGAWPGRLNTVIRTPCPSKECVGLLWQIRKVRISAFSPHIQITRNFEVRGRLIGKGFSMQDRETKQDRTGLEQDCMGLEVDHRSKMVRVLLETGEGSLRRTSLTI